MSHLDQDIDLCLDGIEAKGPGCVEMEILKMLLAEKQEATVSNPNPQLALADLLQGSTIGILRDGSIDVLKSEQVEMIVSALRSGIPSGKHEGELDG